jgi:hypothetical protein
MLGLAQPQLQKWARCSTAVFSFNIHIQREAVTSSSCSQGLQYHAPPPSIAFPPHVATVYNKLTRGGAPSLPGPSFMHVLSSVCCLFQHLPSLSVRFLRKARAGVEKMIQSKTKKLTCSS